MNNGQIIDNLGPMPAEPPAHLLSQPLDTGSTFLKCAKYINLVGVFFEVLSVTL